DVTEIEPEIQNALTRLINLPADEDGVFAPRRWLAANRRTEVSLLDIRRQALGRRLNASQTRSLLDGLVRAGWLKFVTARTAGRFIQRWQANPQLYSGASVSERSQRSERGVG